MWSPLRRMIPWLVISALQLAELSVSSVVHMLYGLYIFSSAVAGDLTQALSESIFKPKTTIEVEQIDQGKTTDVNDLPPIVLVHGIFGFGKGVSKSFFSPLTLKGFFFFFFINWICHCRDWVVYHTLLEQRRRTREC